MKRADELRDGDKFRRANGSECRVRWVYPTADGKKIVIIFDQPYYKRGPKREHWVVDPEEMV